MGTRSAQTHLALIVGLVTFAGFAPTFAWGPEGHRISGWIAEQYLTEDARAAVRDLLDGQTLTGVAVWADEVREQEDDFKWTAPLHYVNVPREAARIDMQRDCENGLCVVGAIQHYIAVIRNEDGERGRAERREALKFLVHFIGDVHQPMHVAYRDDRGGNWINVSFVNNPDTNLHRVWDTDMIRHRIDGSWPDLARDIKGTITDDDLAQWRRSDDPVEWANESLAITRRIYDALPHGGHLGQDYYDNFIGDVTRQLAKAGVRLAHVVNDLFNDGAPAPDDVEVNRQPAERDEGKPDAQQNGAMAHLQLVEGETCGRLDGLTIYLLNAHEEKVIRARVRRTWTTPAGERSVEHSVVVRPGERHRQRLGCSEQPESRGEVRHFHWEILAAEFR